MIEPGDKESSSDDDDMQTVRHRSLRHAEEGSSTVGEGTSASQAPAPTVVNHSPTPAGAVDNAQLALIPVQIIDDSSPEAENRVLPLDAPHEEPSDVPVLEQIAPDSIPVPSEASPETMLAIIVYEPPIEEVPNVVGTGDDVIGAAEEEAAEPVPNVVDQELPPPAPQVAEAEELEDLPEPAPEVPEPVPEVPIAEPPEVPVAESPTPSTLERVLEYLRVLLREGAITEEQFQEIDQLLQDLPQGLNERAVANAQARQTEMHYQNLNQQTETARDVLGDQANLIRDLTLERNHLRSQIQAFQARLTDVTAMLVHAEPQLEQPLAALETLSQELAQAHVAAQQAAQAAADASFRLDELFLRLTHAGRRLLGP
ncbi:uncharacterized protein LOC133717020 [Rosa rugosa]|uniref:uncharacterized protein LOC133717020 n=1 Tax=Rosa rugosa TaxID=74645 RepID=UPI002B40283A|nr:uncharacterized protein LOC133717020 [Rosa rugosa]